MKKDNSIITKVNIINNQKGKLSGWIYSLKDNIITSKIKTTAGSRILMGYIPSYDSTIYDILRKDGATLHSKTNMDELGQGGMGYNQQYGRVHNPWNKERISGGSSSGSCYQVAKKIVRFSIGTDTGDSCRTPAAFCGVVGFKPSWGRISRFGVIPYSPSLDTVGIISNCIDDTIIVFNELNGYDKNDMTSIHEKINIKKSNYTLKNLRITTFKNINKQIYNKEYHIKYNSLITNLKKQGVLVKEIMFDPKLLKVLLIIYKIISNSESISCCANLNGLSFGNRIDGKNWEEMFINSRTKGFGLPVKKRFLLGLYCTKDKNREEIFVKAKKIRRKIVEYFNDIYKDTDCILGPIYGDVAPYINKDLQLDNDIINYLLVNNFCGSPSLSIPFGKINKLPIGVNISTNYLEDEKCLLISKEIEKLINWQENK